LTGRILVSRDDVEPVLRACRVVAVLGCHREPARPAHYVPAYLHGLGRRILPVNPTLVGSAIFGVDVRARLDEIEEAVDVVNVFRRSGDVAAHVGEILAMRPLPAVVWLQSGITNAEACARLRAAGIDTVEDRCMLADGRVLGLQR
jgi:predicted CoA-binding protein